MTDTRDVDATVVADIHTCPLHSTGMHRFAGRKNASPAPEVPARSCAVPSLKLTQTALSTATTIADRR